ncbi:hypothetical protein C9374_005698 [Naegleria lovaniensis]|uniref:Uncharacterized protein n=1 Tax=Naegleria lovaniensis TaxID=51637 RepID=A0AA88KMW3_NAELO|nr:uncharacterized protein C9374_005698 [Naegleria lovaniensis]KAG2381906.1 hypothetical protein C9374_005698 [Naegleria lovaniensis]
MTKLLKSAFVFVVTVYAFSVFTNAELYSGDKKDALDTKDTSTAPIVNTWWANPNAFFVNQFPFGTNIPASFWKTNIWNGNNGVFWNAQLNPFNNALFFQNGLNQAMMFPGLQNGNLLFGAFGNNGFAFPAWNGAILGVNNAFPGVVPPFGAVPAIQAKNAVHFPVTEGYDIEYNFPGGKAKQFFAQSKIESKVF